MNYSESLLTNKRKSFIINITNEKEQVPKYYMIILEACVLVNRAPLGAYFYDQKGR